jgi:glutamate/tyrosine decarboxylase-like PLP-dependent enzyme
MRDSSLRDILASAAERAIRYLDEIDARPVFPCGEHIEALSAALGGPLPEAPANPSAVVRFIDEFGAPATVASTGGRYFGFVTGGALPATVAANWLATAWDQNSFSHISSPATALFEDAAIRWLKQALRLPAEAAGALVTGATMANFTCLAAARDELLWRSGWDAGKNGLFGAPEVDVILGEEVHGTVLKVLSMLGLGRDRVILVPVDDQGRMRPDRLPAMSRPAIVCLQAGNVNSGAFDPAGEIIAAAKSAGCWIHVDGAFGLWARASDTLSPLADGFDGADSWATDAHKWLNVPYDCGAAFVRDPAALRRAMSISGDYLLLGEARNAIDATPESSRRARGIEVWAALKSLGREGLAQMIERNCAQARQFADGLSAAGVDILNEVVLNQVVAAFGDDETTSRVIGRVQSSGICWCGGTTWRGRHAMRISVSSWATSEQDVSRSLRAILDAWALR